MKALKVIGYGLIGYCLIGYAVIGYIAWALGTFVEEG